MQVILARNNLRKNGGQYDRSLSCTFDFFVLCFLVINTLITIVLLLKELNIDLVFDYYPEIQSVFSNIATLVQ